MQYVGGKNKMLYKEDTKYRKTKPTSSESSTPPHSEEFVECLRNALKIMETKNPQFKG